MSFSRGGTTIGDGQVRGARAVRADKPGSPATRPRRKVEDSEPEEEAARTRFRHLDEYRVAREWDRYEGTAQRRLFRDLRARFLDRHAVPAGWVLDLGSGPGRFLPHVGKSGARRVALDLSVEMLRKVERQGRAPPELVRGDGVHPPFRRGGFQEVVVLGNALGFAGAEADLLWVAAGELVAPGGCLILEIVAGAGERARYLCRLPPSSLDRLFRSPVSALVARVDREGFALDPPRRSDPGSFRRYPRMSSRKRSSAGAGGSRNRWPSSPALGSDRERVEGVATDPVAWDHLVELEEIFGHREERTRRAIAVLLAVRVPPVGSV